MDFDFKKNTIMFASHNLKEYLILEDIQYSDGQEMILVQEQFDNKNTRTIPVDLLFHSLESATKAHNWQFKQPRTVISWYQDE